jgi:hypothetical protein
MIMDDARIKTVTLVVQSKSEISWRARHRWPAKRVQRQGTIDG